MVRLPWSQWFNAALTAAAYPTVHDGNNNIIGVHGQREAKWPPHRMKGTPAKHRKRVERTPFDIGTIHQAQRYARKVGFLPVPIDRASRFLHAGAAA